MKYIYLELIKRTVPYYKNKPLIKNKDTFTVLGNFDILTFISNPNNSAETQNFVFDDISSMKSQYENRHASASDEFGIGIDRQPIYLCSSKTELNKLTSMLSSSWSESLLVMSLIQLDKSKKKIWESATSLINAARKTINESFPSFETSVFCHFGECDIVVFSKVKKISDTVSLLNCMWNQNEQNNDLCSVVSSYSLPCIYQGLSQSELVEQVENLIKNHDIFIKYMINRNSCMTSSLNNDSLTLLGDYDYLHHISNNKFEQLYDVIINEGTKLGDYKSSQILLGTPTNKQSLSAIAKDKKLEKRWNKTHESLKKCYDNLKKSIKNCGYSYPIKVIDSLGNTLLGMHNYCFLLRDSRLAEDVYWYTEPMFENLSNIMNDMTNHFNYEANCISDVGLGEEERIDHSQNVAELINQMLTNFQTLIKELQHFYSILSLSSRSFTEMYGCSMRSANATTKLIGAYHGILNIVFDSFGNKQHKQEKIIVPSRDIQICQETLFSHFTPKHRIIMYYMNFESLFDYPKAIFALLHEAGHTVGNRLRQKRAKYFIKAAIKFVVDEFFLIYDEQKFDKFLNLASDVSSGQTFFDLLINKKNFDEYKAIIDDMYKEQYNYFYKKVLYSYEKYLEDYADRILSEQDLNYYLTSLVQRVSVIIENNMLGIDLDARAKTCTYFSKVIKNCCFKIVIKLLNEMKTNSCFYNITNNTVKHPYIALYEKSKELYTHITSQMFETDKNISTSAFEKNAKSLMLSTLGNSRIDIFNELDTIGDVFGDIYADLFACYILNFSSKKDIKSYYNFLTQNADIDISKVISEPFVIRCIITTMTVLNISKNDAINLMFDFLSTRFKYHSQILSMSENLLNVDLNRISWFDDVFDYATDCKKSIFKQLDSIKKDPNKKAEIEDILKFYLSNKTNASNYIIKFWYANKKD